MFGVHSNHATARVLCCPSRDIGEVVAKAILQMAHRLKPQQRGELQRTGQLRCSPVHLSTTARFIWPPRLEGVGLVFVPPAPSSQHVNRQADPPTLWLACPRPLCGHIQDCVRRTLWRANGHISLACCRCGHGTTSQKWLCECGIPWFDCQLHRAIGTTRKVPRRPTGATVRGSTAAARPVIGAPRTQRRSAGVTPGIMLEEEPVTDLLSTLTPVRDRIVRRASVPSSVANDQCSSQSAAPSTCLGATACHDSPISETAGTRSRANGPCVDRKCLSLYAAASTAQPSSSRPARDYNITDLIRAAPVFATANAFKTPDNGDGKRARSLTPRPVWPAKRERTTKHAFTTWSTDNTSRPPGVIPPQGMDNDTSACRRAASLCDLARSSIGIVEAQQRRTYSQRSRR